MRYLLKRLLLLVPILFAIGTIVFFLLHMVPGDPIDLMLGEQALPLQRNILQKELGLDQPLASQYFSFWKNVSVGNWGTSIFDRRPVLEHIREHYGATLQLALGGMFVAVCVGLPLGIFAALKKYSVYDSLAMLFSLVGISVPNFWLGALLILYFGVYLGLLPVAGRESFSSLILPSLTLGMALASILSRMTRASMLEVLDKEYVMVARAKGLLERQVILKHALKNALNPVVTIIGLQVGTLLAGAIITEKIFDWPGLGTLLIESIQRRDYPVVQGCVLLIAFGYVLINTLTDFVYRFLDPRVRLG